MRWEMSMEKRKRRKFTDEFKREAVRLVKQGDGNVSQVARDLDLSVTALRKWVKQDEIDRGKGPPEALSTAERDELQKLRRRVRTLEEEREILKKAAVRSMGHRNTMTTHTLRKDMVTNAKTNETTSVGSRNRGALASVAGRRLSKQHFTIVGPKAWLYLPSPHRGRRLSASAPSTQSRTSVFGGTRRDLEGALCGALASKRGRSSWSSSVDCVARSAA